MKKSIKLILTLLTAALVFNTASCGQKPVVLKLAEIHIDGYPTSQADKEFARLVQKKTGGRIKIEVYTGGALYTDETESIKALIRGEVDFARVSSAPVSPFVPEINLVNLPYLFRNRDHMWKILNSKIGQEILDNIEQSGSGIVGICYYDADCRSFYTKTPVRKLADLAGMKIRVVNSDLMKDMIGCLGGTGVSNIGTTDVYSALQNGFVDGAENNFATYESMGDFLVAGYYTRDSHTWIPEILAGSKLSLSKLSEKDVKIIKSCAQEVQEYEIQRTIERQTEAEEKVKKAGITVIELSSENRKEFEKATEKLYEKYAGQYKDLIKTIKEM